MVRKNYKYKIVYKVYAGRPREIKVETYQDLEKFIGSIMMLVEYAVVHQKINGLWEEIRRLEGHIIKWDD